MEPFLGSEDLLIDMAELKEKKQELSDIYNHYFEEGGEGHE